MEFFKEHFMLVLPLLLLQLGLAVAALVSIAKNRKYKFGNTILWVIIVICVNIIGPIAYFTVGRAEE